MVQAEVFPFSLPFSRPVVLGGRRHAERRGWLLRLRDGDGHEGWGEASPLPGFSPDTFESAGRALHRLVEDGDALGDAIRSTHDPGVRWVESDRLGSPAARFAIELAEASLRASQEAVPVSQAIWAQPRTTQSTNAVLLADAGPDELERVRKAGYGAVKLKVGARSVAEDSEWVRWVADALRSGAGAAPKLRLDANRAWSWDEAAKFAQLASDVSIEYIEEPLRDSARLQEYAERSGLPIALDESLGEMDPAGLRDMPWVKALVIKPTILGGIGAAKMWVSAASATGARVVVSSAVETGIALRGLASLACGIGSRDVPAGLDTARLFARDVTVPDFRPEATIRTDAPSSFSVSVESLQDGAAL